ncbi:ATPase [Streptomyces alfalfae]|uniref:ATPase n=1 Tax=Streptomyces alfalfae TaxID=1642299 RepID=A0ABN4VMX6_9ACTN|nr:BadF/BadG/BcrA/BcrD ATPase family protein [Streptomyces alfalfae]AYA18692.1 ATPase [Streptomyces fradiae]APY88292.1 ATPase [Streptomyces alfalfae]QUI31792.1 ATPase [Streptomyces alfalfae]RXX46429.1 ATPase [Streptomyces alfalfae]RZM92734.1 ATPase [Streptomyces alfalfae]
MGVGTSVLAIDAGNSKTDVAVVAADGEVVGAARGGGFQPPQVGVETAVDVLAEAVARAFAEAGVDSVGHVSACLANADLPVEERELADALRRRAWGPSVDVRNDTFAILRAGLLEDAEPRGVAVVCGAGINCVGMLPDGRTARFPAIGRLSGDWGGGGGLAEEALWHAARAEDGRGEATALRETLPAHFGLDSMYALIEALHLGRIPAVRRHELTPVLFATAAAGDGVARSLVDRMADEVVAMSAVALERLGLLAEEAPVLLGGSVLAARHPQLDNRIAALLAERAPKAEPRVVVARPVLGAALLGLDQVGAPTGVHARVREQYESDA